MNLDSCGSYELGAKFDSLNLTRYFFSGMGTVMAGSTWHPKSPQISDAHPLWSVVQPLSRLRALCRRRGH